MTRLSVAFLDSCSVKNCSVVKAMAMDDMRKLESSRPNFMNAFQFVILDQTKIYKS